MKPSSIRALAFAALTLLASLALTAQPKTIQTVVTINVGETIKGSVSGGTISVVVPGGEVDGVGEWYSHSARFQDSEEVVVFAKKDQKGVLRVTEGEQGKFLVKQGTAAGSKVIPNIGSLADFTAQIDRGVKAQASGKNDQ